MRKLMAVLLLVVVGAVAPGAGAGEIARLDTSLLVTSGDEPYEPGTLAAGPVLAGGRAVWAQAGPGQSFVIRSAVAAGVAPETLATLPLPQPRGFDGDAHLVRLYGAPNRLAWFEGVESFDDAKYMVSSPLVSRFEAGPPGGPYATVAGCDAPGRCGEVSCLPTGAYGGLPWASLSDDALVVGAACTGAPGLTRVGLGDGGATTVTATALPEAGAVPLAAAGDLVALRRPGGALTLRSASDGHAVAALPPLPAGQNRSGASLRADGAFVAVRRPAHGEARTPAPIELRRPGDPRVRTLDVGAIGDHVELAGDRVVFARRPAAGARELAVADLGGRAVRPLLELAPGDRVRPRAVLRGYTLSGDRVAWIVTRCEQTLVGVATLGDAPVVYHPVVCASPRIVSPGPLRLRRDGRVSVALTCARACHGLVRLWGSTGPEPVLGRFRLVGSTAVRHVLVRVPRSTRRAVARGDHAQLALRLSTDPSSLPRILSVRSAAARARRR